MRCIYQLPREKMHPLSLLPLALLMLALVLVNLRRRGRRGGGNPPPSPWKLPIIGNLHQLIMSRSPLPYRTLAALSDKHGPIMLLQIGRVQTLVVSSADVARELFDAHDLAFSERPSLIVPSKMLYGCKDVAFAPYGDSWRNARKLIVRHLLSPPKIRSYHSIREEEAASMVGAISRRARLGGPMNLSDVITSFVKEVTSRIAFGKRSSEEGWNETADALLKESNDLIGSFHFGDYFPWCSWLSAPLDARVERAVAAADEIFDRIIVGRRGAELGAEISPFIDVLLSLHKDEKLGVSLGVDGVKAIIVDMFAAGTLAPIFLLEWAMAELLRTPEAMEKLKAEVRGGANPPTARLKEEDLAAATYLKAVIKEVFRLYPPSPLLIPREAMADARLQGYDIAKNTRLVINGWAIGRDPRYWEAPDDFRPERFLDDVADYKGRDFELIPFGAGRRACPGHRFATSIVEVALANLVRHFDWELPKGMTAGDIDMVEAPGFALHKQANLYLVAMPPSL